jgi:ABC-type multidrug transport system fused ATPase/permease subunit
MQKSGTANPSAWPIVKRLFRQAGGQRNWFFVALGLDLIQAVVLILVNHFNRTFFDAVMDKNAPVFWMFAGLAVALSVLNIPLAYFRARGVGLFTERTLNRLRSSVAERSAALPVDVLEARHSGDLLSVLNADLGKLKAMLSNHLLDLVGHTVRGIAALVYIISVNWLLALVATVFTPLIFLAISALTRPIGDRSEEMQTEIGQVNSVAQDGLSGAMVVKAFNLTGLMDDRFHQANLKALQKGLKIARLKAMVDGISQPMAITPFILAMGLGGYFVIENRITFGALFAFINLLNYVVNPLMAIPAALSGINEAAGAARRVFDLVDGPVERTGGAITRAKPGPALVFDRLSFAYAGETNPVLKHISMEIPTGQTVAIVGPSGSGKSTLIKLILGYYPIADRSLSLFGSDLNDWQLPAARAQMAFVAQDTYLFPISLGENIRLGKPGASQQQVEQAARLANIHDFIASLPDGYQTGAGEWGARLSGGQRQRISLARAILKDAPILLLDEPTSALDTESEALVQQALERFTQGRTTLIIAHRLSTIKNADRVLVLQDGEIVEQGTHAELIARGGVYLDLYQRQFSLDAPAGGQS